MQYQKVIGKKASKKEERKKYTKKNTEEINESILKDMKYMGLTNGFNLEELNLKRKRKILENHPDKVENMSSEIKRFATEETKKLIQRMSDLRVL